MASRKYRMQQTREKSCIFFLKMQIGETQFSSMILDIKHIDINNYFFYINNMI